MKKMTKIVLSLMVTGLTSAAFAQDDAMGTSEASAPRTSSSPDRFFRRAIVEGSLVNAGWEGSQNTRYSKPNGYAAGILFDIIGTQSLVLELGAMYRQLGTTVDNGLGSNDFTANYISVPVAAKYYFSGQESTSLYLKAGLMGSVLVSNNTVYATRTTQVGPNNWETAALAGLGLKVNVASSTDLLLEADYTRSIDSVFSNQNVYRSDLGAALGVAINL
jgi:hypothetical protein